MILSNQLIKMHVHVFITLNVMFSCVGELEEAAQEYGVDMIQEKLNIIRSANLQGYVKDIAHA